MATQDKQGKDNNKGKREGAAERRIKAFELRKAGASYRAIGGQLGVSEAQAYNDVAVVLKKLNEQALASAETVRAMELERLDALQTKLWQSATKDGNQGAVDRIIRIMERRAKLLGLDAPAKQEVTGKDGMPVQVEIDDISKLTESQRASRFIALLNAARARSGQQDT